MCKVQLPLRFKISKRKQNYQHMKLLSELDSQITVVVIKVYQDTNNKEKYNKAIIYSWWNEVLIFIIMNDKWTAQILL